MKKLKVVDKHTLKSFCDNLASSMEHNEISDLDKNDLFKELEMLSRSVPEDINKAIDVLNYIKDLDCIYPNAWIAYRIMLTLPVTVAHAERSFSKLKLIKSYLRSTMSQERLSGLATLSIEKDMVEKLDYTNLISTFASKSARRIMF